MELDFQTLVQSLSLNPPEKERVFPISIRMPPVDC